MGSGWWWAFPTSISLSAISSWESDDGLESGRPLSRMRRRLAMGSSGEASTDRLRRSRAELDSARGAAGASKGGGGGERRTVSGCLYSRTRGRSEGLSSNVWGREVVD